MGCEIIFPVSYRGGGIDVNRDSVVSRDFLEDAEVIVDCNSISLATETDAGAEGGVFILISLRGTSGKFNPANMF